MKRPWIFLINPFLTATKDSYRLMKQLGDFTVAALNAYVTSPTVKVSAAAVTIFNELLAMLTPLAEAYNEAYTQWISQQGVLKGKTQSLSDLLDELRSNKIEEWDLAIQNVYRQNTPQYIALLPHHRTPFQSGGQQERITAMAALSLSIGSDAALQTLKAEVDSFYDELVVANTIQKGSKTKKGGDSSNVDAQRILLAQMLYGVLGSLINYFKETPETIGNFFYMPALHGREQSTFRHDVNIDETLVALTHTFEAGDRLKITDRGHTVLQMARVHEKNDAMPPTAVTIQPQEDDVIPVEALGPLENRYLIVKNMSATEKGAYTIEVLYIFNFAFNYIMNWKDYITSDKEILLGKPAVKGTRISVEHIVGLLAQGWSEIQILENYPRLTKDSLQAVFLYIQECIHDGLLFSPIKKSA